MRDKGTEGMEDTSFPRSRDLSSSLRELELSFQLKKPWTHTKSSSIQTVSNRDDITASADLTEYPLTQHSVAASGEKVEVEEVEVVVEEVEGEVEEVEGEVEEVEEVEGEVEEVEVEGEVEEVDGEEAEELSRRWFLTFEQFVAAVQQEPELCQFFAEQNVIDVEGSPVDPLLSDYTRAVLAFR